MVCGRIQNMEKKINNTTFKLNLTEESITLVIRKGDDIIVLTQDEAEVLADLFAEIGA